MKLNGHEGTITDASGYLYNCGATDYKILIPENATEPEKYAAKEVKRIFSLAYVDIKTVTDKGLTADETMRYISIGNTVYFKKLNVKLTQSEFKFDGFIIKNVGNTYVIKGVSDTGDIFGAYGFMEYIAGYVYYAPDEAKINYCAFNKNFDIKFVPSFFGRNAYSYDSHFNIDYGFRLRINGEYSMREKKHGVGTPWSKLSDQSYALEILDYKKYMPLHPDWFYLPESAKNGANPPRSNPQICYSKGLYDDSDGGMYKTFLSNLINNYIIPESGKSFFMLGMSDNEYFCDCPACREEAAKYKKSGLAMRFVNKVAKDVEKWRQQNAPEREIYLVAFAYLSIFEPPVTQNGDKYLPIDESVIAQDNVIIQIAPISANYLYPINDGEHNLAAKKCFDGWKVCAKHFAVWDYRQDFGTQTFLFPTTVTAQKNNDFYYDYGVMDIFNQAQPFTAGSPFMFMDNFARSRLHLNAKDDYGELCAEFITAYYKTAAPHIKAYLKWFEDYYKVMEKRGYNGGISNRAAIKKRYYTKAELLEAKRILTDALCAAKDKKVYDRVNALTLFYKFTLLLCFWQENTLKENLALIKETKEAAKAAGLKTFFRREKTKYYLKDLKKLVKGKIDYKDSIYLNKVELW